MIEPDLTKPPMTTEYDAREGTATTPLPPLVRVISQRRRYRDMDGSWVYGNWRTEASWVTPDQARIIGEMLEGDAVRWRIQHPVSGAYLELP